MKKSSFLWATIVVLGSFSVCLADDIALGKVLIPRFIAERSYVYVEPDFGEPVETWELVGFAVSVEEEDFPDDARVIMPEVILDPEGGYRMYFTVTSPGQNFIYYSESEDGLNWELQGIIFEGPTDMQDTYHTLGGPSVLLFPNGMYRMYMRTSPAPTVGETPDYRILSAISEDGIDFEIEDDERIGIDVTDADSQFSLVGHSSFYVLEDGSYAGVITAEPADIKGASDLFLARSEDGITWTDFEFLYEDLHDPVVVYQDGQYLLYAQYMSYDKLMAVSEDGINWPESMSAIDFVDEEGNPLSIEYQGDQGMVVTEDGKLLMYTNYGNPPEAIAIYQLVE